MIVLPDYELIIVKCKKETAKDDLRKLIPAIIQKEKRFVEYLETRRNEQIVSFKNQLFIFEKRQWKTLMANNRIRANTIILFKKRIPGF